MTNRIPSEEEPRDRIRDIGDVDAVLSRLIAAIVQSEMDELSLPHVVVCTSRSGGPRRHYGPFATALDALEVADREQLVSDEDGLDVDFEAVPLFPTRDLEPTSNLE